MTGEPRQPDHAAPGPEEDEDVGRLAIALETGRPVPSASFRGALRRHLLAGVRDRERARPRRLRLVIAAYAGSGFALVAIAMIGVIGAGPLATG